MEYQLVQVSTHSTRSDGRCTYGVSESADEQIEAALRAVDGQKLVGLTLDAATRATTFTFDHGATLTTWPYEADEDERWSLYLPGRGVLTYRADGRYSVGPGDEKPGQEVWHAVTRSTRVL